MMIAFILGVWLGLICGTLLAAWLFRAAAQDHSAHLRDISDSYQDAAFRAWEQNAKLRAELAEARRGKFKLSDRWKGVGNG